MFWYKDEIERVEKERNKLEYEPGMIFYGSSSIRLWDTLYKDFAMFYPINLGFGGSTLEACVWFFERIMQPFKPNHIVVYAGDNDLGDGKKPEQVFSSFQQLCSCIHVSFGNVPFTFISIKPSIARWKINHSIDYTNLLIKRAIDQNASQTYFVNVNEKMIDAKGYPVSKFYEPDGLHLSAEGYLLWKDILLPHLLSVNDGLLNS